jgi:hypothetical protein
VAKEQLDRPQIAGAAVDQGGLGPPQRVRAELVRIKTYALEPFTDKPSILPRREGATRSVRRRK